VGQQSGPGQRRDRGALGPVSRAHGSEHGAGSLTIVTVDLAGADPRDVLQRMAGLAKRNADSPDLLQGMAALLAFLGARDRAAALYQRVAHQHGRIEAREQLVGLFLDAGDPASAEAALDAAFAAAADQEPWRRQLCLSQEAVAEAWWRAGDADRCLALLAGLSGRHAGYFADHRPDRLRRAVLAGLEEEADRPASREPEIDIGVVLWGERFARLFLDQLLPCLRAPGNLPALAARRRVRLTLRTDPDTAGVLETAPELAALDGLATVAVRRFDATLLDRTVDPSLSEAQRTQNKLRVVAAGHEIGLRLAGRARADFVALYPDWVVSDGYLEALAAALDDGVQVLMAAGLPADQDRFAPELHAGRRPDGSLVLDAADLARAGVRHLHPFERQHLVHVTEGEDPRPVLHCAHRPNRFLWPVGGDGLVMRSAHWFVAAAACGLLRQYRGDAVHGLDHRLIDALLASGADPAAVRFVEDTEAFAVIGLNRGAEYADLAAGASDWDVERIARAMVPGRVLWALSPVSLAQLDRDLVVRPGDGTDPAETRTQAARFMSAVRARQRQFVSG